MRLYLISNLSEHDYRIKRLAGFFYNPARIKCL